MRKRNQMKKGIYYTLEYRFIVGKIKERIIMWYISYDGSFFTLRTCEPVSEKLL